MSQGRLAGKVAIVTGGGSRGGETGTGEAMAVCMAREGASVLVADIAAENAERTVAAIAAEGGEASVFIGDGSLSGDCRAMVEEAVERYGGLHVLVNNLGYRSRSGGSGRGVTGFDEEQYTAAMDLNLKSALLASKHAIPAMAAAGGGSIINVSSIDGLAAARHYGVLYSVSKGALHMLTKATAGFHGRDGIRANCIAPGPVYTPMVYGRGMSEAARAQRASASPLGIEGTGWDIGNAVVFLSSARARYITGQTLVVDGGITAYGPARDPNA